MPRRKKCRRVEILPRVQFFHPSETKAYEGEMVVLKIEELEAIRLADLEELDQDQCAEKMQISRGTLQRILYDCRKKIADALVNGKAIQIAGGNYVKGNCGFTCLKCNCVWENDYLEHFCPECGHTEIYCGDKEAKCQNTCKDKGCCVKK